jgi:steroid 5-alpha reductase family enzyme
MIQGFWCLLTPLPAYLLLLKKPVDSVSLKMSDYVAWCGWLVGFLTEAIADKQKSEWKAAGNTDFMHTGIGEPSRNSNPSI